MLLSAGARPKRKSKKVLDPDFQCELPLSAFLHDDINIKEQSNPATYDQSTKQSTLSSKPKCAAALSASSSPITIDDTASSALSFDQQLQLVQLKKDKLELELKVLSISCQEPPPDNTLADRSLQDAAETTKPQCNKPNIDWPQDFVPSIQGEYDKIELPEFISVFLIMIKSYDTASKDAMLAHLELLTIKAISYSWVGVRAFHKFITKQVKQHRFWIGKILSLFRIRPPLFSAIQIYVLRTNAQPRTLGYLLTLPPLAIIHKRLNPLLPRLVELGIIPAFATVISK
ncbi:unnamed protein product [Porites lobata]|uniref:Uncharacterized protein n=1 Tax=Porites lobata TaxID=104759 RepID=A0ABN8MQL5_9CNID|nr:unnamed protein product [Porites lobata]